jgi:hypothetical protein
MHMNNSMKMGLVKATLFSILIALSGMAAIASADEEMPIANMFYGNVTLNDADAPLETVINAYIDEELRGSSAIDKTDSKYCIAVVGNESEDEGRTITFTVCGAAADQTAEWLASYQSRPLDLTAVDNEAPAVTDANANPTSIVNGTDTTQLNVTVIDGCRCTVGNVTVNLSAIGGDAAQVMTRIGDTDVYTVTTNATEGTALGAYDLQVNASDIFGKCNTSVYIALEVTTPGLPKTGDINGNDAVTLADAIYLAKHVAGMSGYETLYADGDINGNDAVTLADAIYLAKHVAGMSGYETLY